MAEQEDAEFISPHKYIKNTSTNGTVLTEHLQNISRRLQTPKRTRKIPLQLGRMKERKKEKRNQKRDQTRYTDGQQTHERMLNITNH